MSLPKFFTFCITQVSALFLTSAFSLSHIAGCSHTIDCSSLRIAQIILSFSFVLLRVHQFRLSQYHADSKCIQNIHLLVACFHQPVVPLKFVYIFFLTLDTFSHIRRYLYHSNPYQTITLRSLDILPSPIHRYQLNRSTYPSNLSSIL